MSKEEKNELQENAAGGEIQEETSENNEKPESEDPKKQAETATAETEARETGGSLNDEAKHLTTDPGDSLKEPGEQPDPPEPDETAEAAKVPEEVVETSGTTTSEAGGKDSEKEAESLQPGTVSEEVEQDPEEDIDASNAEDAEDSENERRHHIPFLDYHSLSMENLVGELQRLLRAEKVQAIKRHVESIKQEFDQKFRDFLEEKKDEFISRGGDASDFRYNSVTKRQFNWSKP